MPRGEYGYDAPYALVIFGSLAIVSGLGAAIAWWRMPTQAAAPVTLYFVLFLANTVSFFYTTRRGEFLDQSGNAKDVALRNASVEGVSDRVHIQTADMRALPFSDATFDLVVSSLAIHNIRSNADRKRAIAEGFRVIKPGGWMVIADIRATATYADALRTLGALNIERQRLGWRFWWGNPVAVTTLLTASKSQV